MSQQKGILNIPLLPLRSDPSEKAEMISQLLFGESFDVLKSDQNWSYIQNHADGYCGWATTKMLTFLNDDAYDHLKGMDINILSKPCVPFALVGTPQRLFLPAGSQLYANLPHHNTFIMCDSERYIPLTCVDNACDESLFHIGEPQDLIQLGMQFLNAPYLWGGKSVFGIDCSGFIQLLASMHHKQLPRDAKDQCLMGKSIPYAEIKPADVAFFKNDTGKIVHVGLVTSSNQILHASGSVRQDRLSESGIFHATTNVQTHVLHEVRRIFNA